MDQVDQQINNVGFTQRLKDQANAVGMVSKIAGRYISFYSDDLTEMLLDDILEDTVHEMQHIENQTKRTYMNDQQQMFAQEIMEMMIDYENETAVISKKTEDLIKKIPSKKSRKLNPFGTKKKVLFEIENEDIEEVHDSKEFQRKGYQNPFTSAINKAIDDEYEDDFEDDSKEESKTVNKKITKERKINFLEEEDKFIEFEGKAIECDDEQTYKWKAKVPGYMKENIQKYKKEFEKFLVIHNNTSNKEVWKIYDHVTNDLFDEIFSEIVQQFDEVEDH